MIVAKPTLIIDGDVTDIDLSQLLSIGIKGIIFDLDSTLLAPKSGKLTPETEQWLKAARDHFQVAVVSNNRCDKYVQQAECILGMPVIGHAAKPSTKQLLKVLNMFQLKSDEVAVVGDRPLTDIWAGHRAGMKTVLVRTLKSMNEPSWKTFIRNLERIFIKP